MHGYGKIGEQPIEELELLRCQVSDLKEVLADPKPEDVQGSQSGSDAFYRSVFLAGPTGIVVHGNDGTIIDANTHARQILGLSLDQMWGRTPVDPRWHLVHEDGSSFPDDTHPAMVTLRSGEPVHDVVMGVFHPLEGGYRWILAKNSV